jgi:hypothetical protein
MDQQVLRAITTGLRLRNVDVLTALEDRFRDVDDPNKFWSCHSDLPYGHLIRQQ